MIQFWWVQLFSQLLQNKKDKNGSVLQRPVNASGVRIFKYCTAIYSIFERRRQQFVFGERPEALEDVGIPDQRDVEGYRTYLSRLENFPLKKAEYYRELQESTGIQSVRGLSEITGEDWSYIARVLRTLELPAPIRDYLQSHRDPAVVTTFHLRRLTELVRLGDEDIQFARFRKMLDEINSNALEEKTGALL